MASCIVQFVPAFNVSIPFVSAQTEVATTASITVEAPGGGYDYPPVHIITKISPLPPINYLDKFQNVKLTLTDPDGQAQQQTAYIDANGAGSDYVHMAKNGTWIIKISFPGQDFPNTHHNETVHYLPCENQTTFVRNASSWANTGTWVSKAPLNQARSRLGASVVNGNIYAVGGCIKIGANSNSNYDNREMAEKIWFGSSNRKR